MKMHGSRFFKILHKTGKKHNGLCGPILNSFSGDNECDLRMGSHHNYKMRHGHKMKHAYRKLCKMSRGHHGLQRIKPRHHKLHKIIKEHGHHKLHKRFSDHHKKFRALDKHHKLNKCRKRSFHHENEDIHPEDNQSAEPVVSYESKCKPYITRENDKFQICLDASHYQAQEVSVKVIDGKIDVSAIHISMEEEDMYEFHEMHRSFNLPDDIDVESMTSYLNSDGKLIIEAPIILVNNSVQEREVPIILINE